MALAEMGDPAGRIPARVAVVGTATASAVSAQGWTVERVPREATAEGLLSAFEDDLEGVRVLMPAAEAARDVLPGGLRARGAEVDVVAAYRTVAPAESASWGALLRAEKVDVLTFASPSSASHLLEAAGEEVLAIPAIAIGPVTEATAAALGFRVVAVAEIQNTDGLVDAVSSWAKGRG